MKNLREKLNAYVSNQQKSSANARQRIPLYQREKIEPVSALCGFDQTRLEEIVMCDPSYWFEQWDPYRVLFLDTETTGLNGGTGTIAFEIGIAYLENDGLHVRQYVIADYDQEREMLDRIRDALHRHDILVTFNGKSFDIPLMESRMIMNGFRLGLTQYPHLDLLHACRRIYKMRLGHCNLQTLEQAVLGKRREDDLPGAQMPAVFFQYLKNGIFEPMEKVLDHNYEDVVSLAQLTGHLCSVFREPEQLKHPEDLLGLGKTLERGGNHVRARACYAALEGTPVSYDSRTRLIRSYKREQNWTETVELCRRMIKNGQRGAWPYIELAKYYEHVAHDIDRAVYYAAEGMQAVLDKLAFDEEQKETELKEIRRRIERLRKKQYKKGLDGG